jgi:hypothetical protein
LHETLHELKKKRLDGIVLKIYFEKAYDKVNSKFLQQVMRMKGFSQKWGRWTELIVSGGSVSVKVNDELGHYFQTKLGLRQGDPLSSVLFNILVDLLAVLIKRSKDQDLIGGLVPHLVDGGLSVLQYADNTILFLEDDVAKANNQKQILCVFETLSGL